VYRILLVVAVAVTCIAVAGCSGHMKGESQKTAKEEMKQMPEQLTKDIVDIAVSDGRFTTLVAALKAAGLVETLKGKGPFTVFAPTDAAFAKLPAGTVDNLLKDIPALKNVLLYHVVSGSVMASEVVKMDKATTVLGKDVMIKVVGGKVLINDSQVIIPDIKASNGVIHVIDAVLLPPSK
jgi:uncharacterized surface protein with fasciclin (FAS1) repeats